MNIFVFDIETVPDVELGRKINNLENLSEQELAQALFYQRRARTNGSEFLPLYLQKIICISGVLRTSSGIKVWSLGDPDASEHELISRFFTGVERYSPILVSYNGSSFDLPVLHYRALLHGVSAARYWELGDTDNSFRWNNYLNRYHYRHLDLMDVLASYQARATAPLDAIATMLGFPGKMVMDGASVWNAYQNGELAAIRDYCEIDVLNTYLVYLRFELMRGQFSADDYEQQCQQLRSWLGAQGKEHFTNFIEQWAQ